VRGLDLTADTQKKIRDVFESEMELGLAKNPPVASSLQMENTFLPELCDGSGLMLPSISVMNGNRTFSLSEFQRREIICLWIWEGPTSESSG
jgi:hypothetical protein